MLVDSHAHLTTGAFTDEVLEALLKRAQEAGVKRIVNICTDSESMEKGLLLSQKHAWIANTAAITPHEVAEKGESDFPLIAERAKNGKLVAIGETGLDYHYTYSPKKIQKTFLIRYLHLALECNLPVVIHCRDAFSDLFSILDSEYKVNQILAPGVLHCFTGTLAEAKQVLDRGWYLSLSGIVTFKKSDELREVAKIVPLSQLLIETDSPYLAPQSKRGKVNEPCYLPEIASLIAAVKDVSFEDVAFHTTQNALSLFKK